MWLLCTQSLVGFIYKGGSANDTHLTKIIAYQTLIAYMFSLLNCQTII